MAYALKIAFTASEASPFAKTGGLADVASALPLHLQRLGHDVRLFLPFYSVVDTQGRETTSVDFIQNVAIQLGPRSYTFSARAIRPRGSNRDVYLIDCPELYDRQAIYTTADDEAQRFTFLSRAVIECCQRMGWGPDVFHCNDWHTAFVPILLKTIYEWDELFRRSRTLVTIHNLGYQGVFASSMIDELGLGEWKHLFDQEDLRFDRVNMLRTGLIYADAVSTVSPTYAREIQTSDSGMGLQDLLRARSSTMVGILNGVDYDEWSPESDSFIPHRFSPNLLDGKAKNKIYLLDSLQLAPTASAPLIGIVSRLTHQKGLDLCFEVLPDLVAREDVRLAVLGRGEPRYEEFFETLQRDYPQKVCFHRGHHEQLAHVIEAASDMLLMPSRYEPCGLNQMFSLKYGTLPIVRKTGGLADTVEPVDGDRGTGFVFEHFAPDALRWALGSALQVYRDRERWKRLMLNAMSRDFSWSRQAKLYVQLYERLIGA
jgi:starch synthase